MILKNTITAIFILLTANLVSATDSREVGVTDGDFVVELRHRSVKDLAKEEDKTQKYILIVGQNEFLDKDDLLAIKSCIEDIELNDDDKETKIEKRDKILEVFDATGGKISELKDNIQGLACKTFTAERKKEEETTAILTTPNFTGLNDFISKNFFECIANQVDKSRMRKVEGRGFKIPGSYSIETIKRYCPHDPLD